MPIIDTLEKLDYKVLLDDYENVHGKPLKPVIRRKNNVALITKPFIDHYPYELSDSFCGDETYIRVKGKWNYLFFFFDAVKKVILSYYVSPNRDTPSAIKAISDALTKFKDIPEELTFVVDGKPNLYFSPTLLRTT